MHLVPKKFFVTSGSAVSEISDLNAFDQALLNAEIGEQNLISVTSVIPKGAKQVPIRDLAMGEITHCVLAQMRGSEGEMISSGISYAYREDGNGGYVAEGHLHGTKKALKEVLTWKMDEMAQLRDIKFKKIHYKLEETSIPMDHYGACVAALVFVEY